MKKIVKKDWKFLEYNILDAKGQRITFWMARLKKDLKNICWLSVVQTVQTK